MKRQPREIPELHDGDRLLPGLRGAEIYAWHRLRPGGVVALRDAQRRLIAVQCVPDPDQQERLENWLMGAFLAGVVAGALIVLLLVFG